MSSSTLRIRQRRSPEHDEHARYVMPALQATTQGTRTALLNVDSVARALHVQPMYLVKFLAVKLGVRVPKVKPQRKGSKPKLGSVVLKGSYKLSVLQELLFDFIDAYVLCPQCSLPELSYMLDAQTDADSSCSDNDDGDASSSKKKKQQKKKRKAKKSKRKAKHEQGIQAHCRGCHFEGSVGGEAKVDRFILKHAPAAPASASASAAPQPADESAGSVMDGLVFSSASSMDEMNSFRF